MAVVFNYDLFLNKVLKDHPAIAVLNFCVSEDEDYEMYTLRHPDEGTKDVLQFVFVDDMKFSGLKHMLDVLEQEYGYKRYTVTQELYKQYGLIQWAMN